MTTCKHCGKPISIEGTYWVHADGYVMCPGRKTQAQPR